MKSFKELIKEQNDPPMVIVLKRKGIRNFLGSTRVALYSNDQLGVEVTLPYDQKTGKISNQASIKEDLKIAATYGIGRPKSDYETTPVGSPVNYNHPLKGETRHGILTKKTGTHYHVKDQETGREYKFKYWNRDEYHKATRNVHEEIEVRQFADRSGWIKHAHSIGHTVRALMHKASGHSAGLVAVDQHGHETGFWGDGFHDGSKQIQAYGHHLASGHFDFDKDVYHHGAHVKEEVVDEALSHQLNNIMISSKERPVKFKNGQHTMVHPRHAKSLMKLRGQLTPGNQKRLDDFVNQSPEMFKRAAGFAMLN